MGLGVVFAQTLVTGSVVDDNGEPVIGASILIKGTGQGTITDIDGSFTINVPAGSNTLVVSYVGLITQEVAVKPTLRIVLSSDTELLDEVVVVGYGTQKKANLTGAVSTVDVGKTLEARPYSDISKALQGAVPGLSVISSSGQLGKQPSLSIRGLGTLSNDATSKPLIIVDGVAMEDISLLNTQDIEN
ncbi:MAG: carboxypeptidase-like regulatory domain-containing protein, partial [Dysgonamonadaceae bacterium]